RPIPRFIALLFSSSAASSTSRRAIELALSAICLVAPPIPTSSVFSLTAMTPRIQELREHDPGHEGGADHDQRIRSARRLGTRDRTGDPLRPAAAVRRGARTAS